MPAKLSRWEQPARSNPALSIVILRVTCRVNSVWRPPNLASPEPNQATTWLERTPQGIAMAPGNSDELDLHNWLEAQVLRRDAESLLSR